LLPDKRFGDDPQRRCPDITRARSLLGWKPKVDLLDGLTRTLSFFKEKLSGL
jgi:nucleoside-diphosphate-sugar epimerase